MFSTKGEDAKKVGIGAGKLIEIKADWLQRWA